jgi:hypothetical protein
MCHMRARVPNFGLVHKLQTSISSPAWVCSYPAAWGLFAHTYTEVSIGKTKQSLHDAANCSTLAQQNTLKLHPLFNCNSIKQMYYLATCILMQLSQC